MVLLVDSIWVSVLLVFSGCGIWDTGVSLISVGDCGIYDGGVSLIISGEGDFVAGSGWSLVISAMVSR